ncbi:MAG: helix-turn-helix transcriptional regulator [Acidobacteria bacterium]|nr:helix-turn-helix transcriptional regulator [Acidobacteriota bacterium]MDA1236308.1 helix-turn-helix transcriptional regulator [Acidobacteriota bacterium]
MDVSVLIKQRLGQLGLDQKDLAAAAQVTESYISQLLAAKKPPPSPARTDIYEKIGKFLGLADGELTELAELQRRHDLKRKIVDVPRPLLQDCRELLLRKCSANTRHAVQRIFEKESFGELERLVSQQVLAVAQEVARDNLRREDWVRSMASASGRDDEAVRDAALEFVDADVFHLAGNACVFFLDPLIEAWAIDLQSFALEVKLSPVAAAGGTKRFAFLEKLDQLPFSIERGLEQFLSDKSMSGDATDDEIRYLTMLKFAGRRPTALYFYRELQSLRDQLHFLVSA